FRDRRLRRRAARLPRRLPPELSRRGREGRLAPLARVVPPPRRGLIGGLARSIAEEVIAMGMLVDGRWTDDWYDTKSHGGRFERPATKFRDRVTADGSSGFPAEA